MEAGVILSCLTTIQLIHLSFGILPAIDLTEANPARSDHIVYDPAQRSVARGIVFSRGLLPVCDFVCLSGRLSVNSSVRDIIARHHPRVKRKAKFENCYCGVHEW